MCGRKVWLPLHEGGERVRTVDVINFLTMDYRVNYKLFHLGRMIKEGQFIVKNCSDEFHAKLKLDKHLSKKHTFDRMEADAHHDNDILNQFSNIFGKNWFQ